MRKIGSLAVVLVMCSAPVLQAQVPAAISGRFLLTLGDSPAGFEAFSVERLASGGYRITGNVDLQIPNLHIVQQVASETGERLQFRSVRIIASVNGDTTEYQVRREGDEGVQTATRGDSTLTTRLETPPTSVLLSNNVVHHIVQFAWLHDGGLGDTLEFVAFPRVPVNVALDFAGSVSNGGEEIHVRRYYLNVANRLAVYVWLTEDGRPLKVFAPLRAFTAILDSHEEWSGVLTLGAGAPDREEEGEVDYAIEDVLFQSGDITLAGTLTIPQSDGILPGAVLISGSGPQDRDENTVGPGGLKLGVFRVIADTLTRRGIAVLRYDDRGVGDSGGDFGSAGLSDLVSDVEAAVRYLRARPEVDGSRIALVGHSEGGVIAPIVAEADEEIAAIVLAAGTAAPLDSVIAEQAVSGVREAGGDSTEMAEARRSIEELSAAIRAGRDLEDMEFSGELKSLGQSKWLREHIEHDPLATVRLVRSPVLIVNGGQDVQVQPEHARRLGAALAEVGHPDYEVKIFPELNHLFVVSRGQGTSEYSDPNARVDARFLSYVADWLAARLAP